MVRTYVGQVCDWVRALIGVKASDELGVTDSNEGLQHPRQWQPFDPSRDEVGP